jgi:Ni/Co efflux regulator RcnB
MKRRLAAAVLGLCLAAPFAAAAQGYAPYGPGHGGGFGERGGYGERGGFGGERGGFGDRGGGDRGGYRDRGGFDRGGDDRDFGPGPDREGSRTRGPSPNANRGAREPGPPMRRGGQPGRQAWSRGQYLPPEARGAMIQDFARYHLRRPPRGYYWYRAGDDYVLAAVATGVIFEVIQGDDY